MINNFKSKHSTDFCIFTVKSVSKYYTQQHSPSYTCFLDASKAFDKINHFKLFRNLLDRKTPIVIVRILLFWYSIVVEISSWQLGQIMCTNVKSGRVLLHPCHFFCNLAKSLGEGIKKSAVLPHKRSRISEQMASLCVPAGNDVNLSLTSLANEIGPLAGNTGGSRASPSMPHCASTFLVEHEWP